MAQKKKMTALEAVKKYTGWSATEALRLLAENPTDYKETAIEAANALDVELAEYGQVPAIEPVWKFGA